MQNIAKKKQIDNFLNQFNYQTLNVTSVCFNNKFDPTPEKQKEIKKLFKEIEYKIKEEQTNAHKISLFAYLDSQKGINANQYQTFWTNYLYRTWYTVSAVFKLAEKAHSLGDIDATQYGVNNLSDELAIGKKNESHPQLLLNSGNKFGKTIFGLKDSTALTAKNSEFLLPEALTDRRVRESLYNSQNPIEVFGANYIHEALAGKMLESIVNSVYKPYRKTYNEIQQAPDAFDKEVATYFDVHLHDEVHGNVEDEHMRIARDLTLRYIAISDNPKFAIKELQSAIDAFARSQNYLWDAIQKDMELRAKEGVIIPKDI